MALYVKATIMSQITSLQQKAVTD